MLMFILFVLILLCVTVKLKTDLNLLIIKIYLKWYNFILTNFQFQFKEYRLNNIIIYL